MWKVFILEDGNERELEEEFSTKQCAEIWAESIGFEMFRVRKSFNEKEFNQKVVKNMEEKLNYYRMLAGYTKQSVKLKQHLTNIKLLEESIADYNME